MQLNTLTDYTNSFNLYSKILEFEKRYTDTFLYLSFKHTPTENGFYYLHEILNQESSTPQLRFSNSNWNKLLISHDSEIEIQPIFPQIGLFNFENKVYIFRRFPQRQWKRAPSASNSLIQPVLNILMGAYYAQQEISDLTLNAALADFEITSLTTACTFLNTHPKIEEIAFNENFALFLSPFKRNEFKYLLVYKTTPCALVNPDTYEIVCKNNYIYQEISDYLKTARENLWILK